MDEFAAQQRRPAASIAPQEVYMGGNYTDYDPNYAPGAEFAAMGILTKSLVNAAGGPNLLAVHHDRESLAEPMDYAMPYGTQDANKEVAAMYGITQHHVAERNQYAQSAGIPRLITAPRFVRAPLTDPSVLIRVPGCNRCVQISEGVPLNRALYARQRYNAD